MDDLLTALLSDRFTVRPLCCPTALLSDRFTVRPLRCPTVSLSDRFAERLIISLTVRSTVFQRQRSFSV
ncbi:MAG: hypothetical protein SOT07_02685 [Paludibacteraceae bacterium]|nr:hypothetical protein [Paludibacteraceae bacterium]